MNKQDFIWRFTPSRTDAKLLEDIFVQREPLLADVVERIKDSAQSGNKHHMLLIGPRGIGKTHFISLVNHRVQNDPKLADTVRIAWLNEDETTTSFVQLLVRIYRALAQDYAEEFSADWLHELLGNPPDEVERQLKLFFVKTFQNKTLLILVENLDFLFDGLGDTGQKKWRSFIQEHPFTSILATSQQLFHGVQKQDEVFFGFFTPIHLKPLSLKDAIQLLSKVAAANGQSDLVAYLATPEGRSRVRAIHHLAGGNHRIFIVLSSFITRDALEDLVEPFEKMADELTPYYQERLRWLSAQQRQVVELLCSRTSPMSPSEVARQLLAPENSISKQFKRLMELRYVTRSQRGRDSLYELTEPLMRLANEVKERKPLRLLVSFLRVWYQRGHLSQMLQTTRSESLRSYLSLAIEEYQSSPGPRLAAIQADIKQAKEDGRIDETIEALEEKAHTTNAATDWFELGYYLGESKRYEDAIECYDKALGIDPDSVAAWSNKGSALSDLKRYEDAIECYDKALGIDPDSAAAWSNKGNALRDLKRYEDAIECYDKALGIDPDSAVAWSNKGNALSDLKRYEDAIECHEKALHINPDSANAWSNKGVTLHNLKRYEDAIECYDKALGINPDSAVAWSSKGVTLHNLKRYEDAIECYEKALSINPNSAYSSFNLTEALLALNRWKDGFRTLDRALSLDQTEYFGDTASMVALIHKNTDADELKQYVANIVTSYAKAEQLEPLGVGLVQSLAKIDEEMLSEKALFIYRDAWLELGGSYAELEVPLRLFRVGIEYLTKKRDPKVLFDLIKSERLILEQLFGLVDEDDE